MKVSVLPFLLGLILCVLVMPMLIRFSLKLKLYDDSDLYRKTHEKRISRLGGLGIFFGYLFTLELCGDVEDLGIHALIASSSVMFCLGLKDDLLAGAKPLEKFIVQILAALTFVFFGNIELNFVNLIPNNPSMQFYCFQLLYLIVILFVVNAFNFVDGINGLAGMLGVLINLILGSALLALGDLYYALIAFTVAGATTGFLFFNLIQGLVFMGDSGATLIGLNTVAVCFRFISVTDSSFESDLPFSSIGLVVALLIIPIFDVFRIFFIRAIQRKPLLVGDRNHIHHRLRDLGLVDYQIVLILIGFTLSSVAFIIAMESEQTFKIFGVLTLGCLFANTVLTYKRGKHLFRHYKISDILFIDTFNRR